MKEFKYSYNTREGFNLRVNSAESVTVRDSRSGNILATITPDKVEGALVKTIPEALVEEARERMAAYNFTEVGFGAGQYKVINVKGILDFYERNKMKYRYSFAPVAQVQGNRTVKLADDYVWIYLV